MIYRVLLICVLFCSCSNNDLDYANLKEYMALYSVSNTDDVIACAASKNEDSNTTFVFYYPIPGATNIRYFETIDVSVEKNNFLEYTEIYLPKEDVFNGYLGRFVRVSNKEAWCIVTYRVDDELRTSQPIRMKNSSRPTEWSSIVDINVDVKTKPVFTWEDGVYNDNEIYFQVITNSNNDLLSGTYTYDKWFQYYELENVVLNVTRDTPPLLLSNNSYGFTMMGVSIDNWVNLVIQKDFQIE